MFVAANTRAYWVRVWDLRHLILLLVQLDLRNRYRRTILGIGWSLMNPVLMTAVLCTVFHQIFKIPLRDHIPFVLAGMGIWAFLSGVITEGCTCIYGGDKFIRSTPMPLAIHPLRALLGLSFQFLIVLTLAFVVTLALRGHENPVVLLALIPNLVIVILFGWSVAVLFGFANVYFPDTHQVIVVLLQILYYLTPIFYPPNLLRGSFLQTIIAYNPFAALVSLVREPLVFSQYPSSESYLMALTVTALAFLLALRILTKRERTIIFHL